MRQDEGETVDSYLTRLKLKIDYCEYDKTDWPPAVKNEMTRDKFIFGLIDDGVTERLLRETDLTLERAVALAQRSEASKSQVKAMSSNTYLAYKCDDIQQKTDPPRLFICGRCGKLHKPKSCPAYGQKCGICQKFHHFAKMCRNKPSVAKSLPLDAKKKVFELDESSSYLCTFATPFGRYRFTRMPFGLKSASEVFQKRNEAAFEGIEGIHIVANDIIIAASNVEEHDKILTAVLQRAAARNVKSNFDKLQLRVNEVKYLGTIITHEGMKPDPAKVKAIAEMPTPHDKAAVRHLLGMINFLAAHIPNMASITTPLCNLVKADVHFEWDHSAANVLSQVKNILSTEPVLQFFNPSISSVIQADASQHGLVLACFNKAKPLPMPHVVYLSLSVTTLRLRKSYWQLFFHAQSFTNTFTVSTQRCKQITSY